MTYCPGGTGVSVQACPNTLIQGNRIGTDVGGLSPDGAVRLEQTDCRGESTGTPRVIVDGNVLPTVNATDAATIAAALRGIVPQGRVA